MFSLALLPSWLVVQLLKGPFIASQGLFDLLWSDKDVGLIRAGGLPPWRGERLPLSAAVPVIQQPICV